MVLVRPTVVFGVVSGAFPRRSELAVYGMQIVSKGNVWWAEKAAWFRNVPVTALFPTEGQIQVRIKFGELAKEAKAKRLTGTKDKPAKSERLGRYFVGAAAYIADHMHGFRAPKALPKEAWESRLRRTARTLEDLKAEAARRGIPIPE
jgi:hypothetical protein